jgi:hypothetical protein
VTTRFEGQSVCCPRRTGVAGGFGDESGDEDSDSENSDNSNSDGSGDSDSDSVDLSPACSSLQSPQSAQLGRWCGPPPAMSLLA